jgi:hypothetical protein
LENSAAYSPAQGAASKVTGGARAKGRTLRDAGVYILALPPAEAERQHWQIAMDFLISAAEKGGIVMMAHRHVEGAEPR